MSFSYKINKINLLLAQVALEGQESPEKLHCFISFQVV